ncbi:MAG: FAD-binding oxidoreductase [Labedaea sp.]
MCHTVAVDTLDPHVRHGWTRNGADDTHLTPPALRWLRTSTGLAERSTPVAPDSALQVAGSALADAAREALEAVVGPDEVLVERADRLGRAGGLSYLDLLRHRGCGELAAPDAVVRPADPEQVQRVVEVCAEHGVGIVPFGGGTSVVGGVAALRGDRSSVVVLDLARLNRLVSVDPVSRMAVFQAGVVAPDAEKLLQDHGFTLGHVPQSFERATIGGFAATRSAGQASAGYGRFEDMVEGVRLATPRGEWRLGAAPASAAGPDLRQLVVGSEGTFGVITEVAVRVRPVPKVRRYEGFVLDGWTEGAGAVRAMAQARVLADVSRLSDPVETDVALRLGGGWKTVALRRFLALRGFREPCLLILGWEADSAAALTARRAATLGALGGTRLVRLGRSAGASWLHGRFAGPRQRDLLMDIGVCVETLETATYWSTLDALREGVRDALTGALTGAGRTPVVACHISHAYETGASLYFTVLVPRAEDDPVGQWTRAKAAACAAIGPLGTITHHHAVGLDHAPYLGAEIGELGLDVLRAVKRTLDPDGILNPGKLLA